MTNFPWPDCGKEFEEWYKEYTKDMPDYRENKKYNSFEEQTEGKESHRRAFKEIANAAWDAAILFNKKITGH